VTSTRQFHRKEKKLKRRREANDEPLSRWLLLRYKAFKLYGNQCACCGAKPPQVVLHVDHIKPKSKFPELAFSLSNLQILCEACNMGKSNIDATQWRV
jgi:5-methylcytosine-specific restriction endonuclease McrA